MARKKHQIKMDLRRRPAANTRFRQDIIGIALISLALFIFMSNMTTSTGAVGFYMINSFLRPAIGVGIHLLPYFLAFFGIVIMLRQQTLFLTYQIVGIFVLFFTLIGYAQLYSEKYFSRTPSAASGAGGIVGYMIKSGLEGAVGNVGAYIALSSIMIISVILIFNLTLANTISKLWDYLFTGKPRRKGRKIEDNGKTSITSMMPVIKEVNAMNREIEREDKEFEAGKAEAKPPKARTISKPTSSRKIGKYELPPLDLLDQPTEREKQRAEKMKETIEIRKKALEDTLASFGVGVTVTAVHLGPAVTRFEVQPDPGVKVSKIANLADDISLTLASQGVRIEAPIPGKAAVGIEVPNPTVLPVRLGEIAHTEEFNDNPSKLFIGLGKNLSGTPVFGDLAKMPHLLIAGTTGSGKSVCINSLLMSLLLRARPDEVKLLMIDPKMVEFTHYNDIPHLLAPVVTDPKKASRTLKEWVVKEMDRRYKTFYAAGTRNIEAFNKKIEQTKDTASRKFETEEYPHKKMPYIVVIIDELADMMMVAANEVETTICRIAQMARATGIHLVVATQRPSVDVITGLIKANIPSRISFAVATQVDSRVILDMSGAEKLLGKGDMLYHPIGAMKPTRLQGAFVSDEEIEKVTEFIKKQAEPEYSQDILDIEYGVETSGGGGDGEGGGRDDLFAEAVKIIVQSGQASTSHLQRRLRIGYNRAARLMDEMEAAGIVSPLENDNKPRKIVADHDTLKSLGIN